MKHFKLFLTTLFAILCMPIITSCDDWTEVHQNELFTYSAQIVVTPDTAKIGDIIQLTMGAIEIISGSGISISYSSTGDDENDLKSISYYIDGEFVAESSDIANNYAATYQISDISVGTHTITAHCNPNNRQVKDYSTKTITIYHVYPTENIHSCTLTIEE
ncbi:MAG: hypothetical protein LUC91_06020 [Prevotella sp.]|nr:hypothetical protein [Prevotella sp.]